MVINEGGILMKVQIDHREKDGVESATKYYEKQGLDKKEIIKKIAKDRNVNKNEIYMKFI